MTQGRKFTVTMILGIIAVALLFSGCGDSDTVLSDQNQMVQDFEDLWRNFDRNYSYFEYKNIDWQMIYDEFRPQVDAITEYDPLLELFQEMLAPLRDQHVRFIMPDGTHVHTYTPSHPVNWNEEVWRQSVATNDWHRIGDLGYRTFQSLPYISINVWNRNSVSIEEFDRVLEMFKESPGLILDVRMNGGGDDRLAFQVAGRFTKTKRVGEYVQLRNGKRHSDFTPLTPQTLKPRGAWQFEKPVVLLIGRRCLSSNESFVSAMREIPHVTLIGDTTGGSSGNPTFFKLSNGVKYSVPRWMPTQPIKRSSNGTAFRLIFMSPFLKRILQRVWMRCWILQSNGYANRLGLNLNAAQPLHLHNQIHDAFISIFENVLRDAYCVLRLASRFMHDARRNMF